MLIISTANSSRWSFTNHYYYFLLLIHFFAQSSFTFCHNASLMTQFVNNNEVIIIYIRVSILLLFSYTNLIHVLFLSPSWSIPFEYAFFCYNLWKKYNDDHLDFLYHMICHCSLRRGNHHYRNRVCISLIKMSAFRYWIKKNLIFVSAQIVIPQRSGHVYFLCGAATVCGHTITWCVTKSHLYICMPRISTLFISSEITTTYINAYIHNQKVT